MAGVNYIECLSAGLTLRGIVASWLAFFGGLRS